MKEDERAKGEEVRRLRGNYSRPVGVCGRVSSYAILSCLVIMLKS